jgi:cytochrome c-type protein NapC
MSDGAPAPSRLRRFIAFLRRPPAWSLWSVLAIGAIGGIVFWGGFHTAMEATNTLEFCTGCHEMRDTVYEEYKLTAHWTNRTGVRAVCSDCHVPRDWGHKVVRKIQATGEVYGKLMGHIDTKEKFEAKRMELATNEWNQMKASGSRECRNCHNFTSMDSDKQKPRARTNHKKAQAEGKTCIDCHKGIAHLLPKEYQEEE